MVRRLLSLARGMRAAPLVLILLAGSRVAEGSAQAATEVTEPVRLSIATSECTNEDAFWEALLQRTTRIRKAVPGEPAPRVEIEIARKGARIVGRVRIVTDSAAEGETPATRTVAGESCDEIVATMSLMTALVLDADATSVSPPTAQPVPAPHEDEPAPVAPASPPEQIRWRGAVGAHGVVSTLGGTAFGGGIFVETERASNEHRAIAWLPSWRLTGTFAALDIATGPARATATWLLLRFDACPWRLALAEPWSLRPCASLEGGSLDVSVNSVENAHGIARPWLAPGLRVRLAWSPLDALLLGIDAAALFPLFRDEFKVDPSLPIFRTPPAAVSMSTSLAIRFL